MAMGAFFARMEEFRYRALLQVDFHVRLPPVTQQRGVTRQHPPPMLWASMTE